MRVCVCVSIGSDMRPASCVFVSPPSPNQTHPEGHQPRRTHSLLDACPNHSAHTRTNKHTLTHTHTDPQPRRGLVDGSPGACNGLQTGLFAFVDGSLCLFVGIQAPTQHHDRVPVAGQHLVCGNLDGAQPPLNWNRSSMNSGLLHSLLNSHYKSRPNT